MLRVCMHICVSTLDLVQASIFKPKWASLFLLPMATQFSRIRRQISHKVLHTAATVSQNPLLQLPHQSHSKGRPGYGALIQKNNGCHFRNSLIMIFHRSINIERHPLGGSGPFDTTQLHIFIKESFSGAVLLEEHQVSVCRLVVFHRVHTYVRGIMVSTLQGSVTYQLPSAGLTWASVFRQLESNKERLGIIDYSVSQTTLEQVHMLQLIA